ncbi:hypothetical protein TBLA_0A10770 [Henningerozyma blattae CBS 6284]|uniref:Zn(2)-C6 fungal-type domain-containing protein n=1 Tax=Henningerozyma blattae (strain ATCC 34711 / CBS 6284 / DSM 70876 / NBRC 10599 / NRRL Y-10934 / UCD 77-7) TaxID=1071380 RepID=I2GXK1_HENB6|nr:hypothetical protein TBLA_0A10770 [Tetrapisispora blattae CBS 6284]CCH58853.1 hypothetical protein TBLA_0A10770 [Tetrapisispora blattae CBS 6284]
MGPQLNKKKVIAKYSKHGCAQCKRAHVKCDEIKPICRRCVKKNINCNYESNLLFKRVLNGSTFTTSKIQISSNPIQQNTNLSLLYSTKDSDHLETISSSNYLTPSSNGIPIISGDDNQVLQRKFHSTNGNQHFNLKEELGLKPNYFSNLCEVNNYKINYSMFFPRNDIHLTSILTFGNNCNLDVNIIPILSDSFLRDKNILNFKKHIDHIIENFDPVKNSVNILNIDFEGKTDSHGRKNYNNKVEKGDKEGYDSHGLRNSISNYDNQKEIMINKVDLCDPEFIKFCWDIFITIFSKNFLNSNNIFSKKKLFSSLIKLSETYPVIHESVRFFSSTMLKNYYFLKRKLNYSNFWDRHIRMPSINFLHKSVKILSLKPDKVLEDWITILIISIIMIGPNSVSKSSGWRYHMHQVFLLIELIEFKLINREIIKINQKDEINLNNKDNSRYYIYIDDNNSIDRDLIDVYLIFRSFFLYSEVCSILTCENSSIISSTNILRKYFAFYNSINFFKISGEYDLLFGSNASIQNLISELSIMLCDLKESRGINLSGNHILKLKFINNEEISRSNLIEYGNTFLRILSKDINTYKVRGYDDRNYSNKLKFSEIENIKQRAICKNRHKVIFLALNLYIKVFYLELEKTNVYAVTELLEDLLESWYQMPDTRLPDSISFWTIYFGCLTSLVISKEIYYSQFINILKKELLLVFKILLN